MLAVRKFALHIQAEHLYIIFQHIEFNVNIISKTKKKKPTDLTTTPVMAAANADRLAEAGTSCVQAHIVLQVPGLTVYK